MKRTALYLTIAGALLLFCLLLTKQRQEQVRQEDKVQSQETVATKSRSTPKLSTDPSLTATKSASEQGADNRSPERVEAQRLFDELSQAFSRSGHITGPELEDFLQDQGRSAEALLAAALRGNEPKYLTEALAKEPDNPLLLSHALSTDSFPLEERLQYSERLKELTPDDALAASLHGVLLVKSGKHDEGLNELIVALDRPEWQDYAQEAHPKQAELYQSLGYSPLTANYLAHMARPFSRQMTLAAGLQELRESPLANTSPQVREEMRNLTANLGRRLVEHGESSSLVNSSLGLEMQQDSLEGLSPDDPSPFEGRTVKQAAGINQMQSADNHHLASENPLSEALAPLVDGEEAPSEVPNTFSVELMEGYVERLGTEGELRAIRWAIMKGHENSQP